MISETSVSILESDSEDLEAISPIETTITNGYDNLDIKVSVVDGIIEPSYQNSVNTTVISETTSRRKKTYNRVQHYRQAWKRNPLFSEWIMQGCNSRKAKCRVCNSEMSADISVLKYHAKCTKHLEKLANFNHVASSQIVTMNYNNEFVKKGYYNSDWEYNMRYASWICQGKTEKHAHCKLCDADMPADTGALRRHLATYTHMKAAGRCVIWCCHFIFLFNHCIDYQLMALIIQLYLAIRD